MLHRAVARLAACGCGPRLPLPPNILAFGARGARSATRKKLERDVNQRLSRVDSQRGSEDEGIFKGKITALMGSFMQVTLQDGRVVKAKPSGKMTRPGHFQTLKVGLGVTVQYSLDEDEDSQTPMIISREAAERVAM